MSGSPRPIPDLVDAGWLLREIGSPDLRVVDVRWKLGEPLAGALAYAAGHLPGAVFADIDRDLASKPGARGRHPLPEGSTFTALLEHLGISDSTRVVAYDDAGGATAARLWFLLRFFGHETCAVLDGGVQAWTAAGGTLETAPPAVPRGSFHATPRPELIAEREEVAAGSRGNALVLLDARAPERYRGDTEPIDPKAGHIPGAVNAPFAENLVAGRFRPVGQLADRYRALGAAERPVVAYCGSGVTACHDLLALSVAGFPQARLYPGSWSEWAGQPDAPVATGNRPHE